jgi:hypothetical protein
VEQAALDVSNYLAAAAPWASRDARASFRFKRISRTCLLT